MRNEDEGERLKVAHKGSFGVLREIMPLKEERGGRDGRGNGGERSNRSGGRRGSGRAVASAELVWGGSDAGIVLARERIRWVSGRRRASGARANGAVM
jgi:hypothetical protein